MEQMLNSLGQAVVAGRELAETKTKLDSECKAFLAEKQVLAWILRDCAPEFEGWTFPKSLIVSKVRLSTAKSRSTKI